MYLDLNQGIFASVTCSPIFIVYGYTGYVRGYTYLKFIKYSGESNVISYFILISGLILFLYFIIKIILLYRNILIFKNIIFSYFFLFLILSLIAVNVIYKMNINLYIFSFILSLVSAFSTGRMFKAIIAVSNKDVLDKSVL